MATDRFVWSPWEVRGNGEWTCAYLPLSSNSPYKLGVLRNPKGYEAWIEGRHTHMYPTLEEAIAAGRGLVQRLLRQHIQDIAAILAEVEHIPCPPDTGATQEVT